MRKLRYLIDIVLLGLIFLGITTHIKPMPPEAIFLNSPAEKKRAKKTEVSRTIIDRFAERLSAQPQLTHLAARFLENYKSKSPIEYIRLTNQLSNPESPIWRKLRSIAGADTSRTALSRTAADEPDSFSAADDDFTSETRVNSVTTSLQFQPDFAVGDDGIIYAVWGSDEAGGARE